MLNTFMLNACVTGIHEVVLSEKRGLTQSEEIKPFKDRLSKGAVRAPGWFMGLRV